MSMACSLWTPFSRRRAMQRPEMIPGARIWRYHQVSRASLLCGFAGRDDCSAAQNMADSYLLRNLGAGPGPRTVLKNRHSFQYFFLSPDVIVSQNESPAYHLQKCDIIFPDAQPQRRESSSKARLFKESRKQSGGQDERKAQDGCGQWHFTATRRFRVGRVGRRHGRGRKRCGD